MDVSRVGVAMLQESCVLKRRVFWSMSLEFQILNKIYLCLPGFMFAPGYNGMMHGTQFFCLSKSICIKGGEPFRVYLRFQNPPAHVQVGIAVILDGETYRPLS